MGFKRLEKNLIDIIKEEQAKLGFRKEEIRLYYPLISLNHFFEADDDVDEMQTRLEQFPEEVKKKLGDICVTHKKDRFCLHIPEQGSVYVHEHTAENEFIKKFGGADDESRNQKRRYPCDISERGKRYQGGRYAQRRI